MATPTVAEIAISGGGWNGDFLLDDTGDLVLSVDDETPQATIDRLTRLVLTNANLTDGNGNPIGFADDLFHPDWGASTRAYIGENFTDQLIQTITARIRGQLANDPAVASVPVVSLTLTAPNTVALSVQCLTVDGQTAVLPTINLSPNGASLGVA